MAANSATDSGSLSRTFVDGSTDNFSLSFWINFNTVTSDQNYVFMNGHSGSSGAGWGLYFSGTDQKLHADVCFVSDVSFSQVFTASTWYQVVLTKSSGTWTLYVNGSAATTTGSGTPFTPDSSTIFFGWNNDGTITNGTSIQLAECGYWNRVLTGTEIAGLSTCANKPGDFTTNLIVYLPLTTSASFGTNLGSGGNFTLNGTLAQTSPPSQCSVSTAQYFPQLSTLGVGV